MASGERQATSNQSARGTVAAGSHPSGRRGNARISIGSSGRSQNRRSLLPHWPMIGDSEAVRSTSTCLKFEMRATPNSVNPSNPGTSFGWRTNEVTLERSGAALSAMPR